MSQSIDVSQLGSKVGAEARKLLVRARVDQILVGQAKRRMSDGGDSEFKYPELWEPSGVDSFRTGGQPLLDTGTLRNSLSGFSVETSQGVRSWLIGPLVAIYHQNGFSTDGPNFIPLTLRAKRTYSLGGMKKVLELTFKPPKSGLASKGVKKATTVGSSDPKKRRLIAPSGFKTVFALELISGDKVQDGRVVRSAKSIGKGRIKVTFRKRKRDKKATQSTMRRRSQLLVVDKSRAGQAFSNELVVGTDYIMAWQGVTIPQRKIFNLPPEDIEEIADSIRFALR